MTTKQPTALLTRLQKLIASLETDLEDLKKLEQGQGGYAPTVEQAIAEYTDLARRLKLRLAGSPRTLRRRLGTLKRELARRQHVQDVLHGLEDLGARHRREAALKADMLGMLVGKLEGTLRPGLARHQS